MPRSCVLLCPLAHEAHAIARRLSVPHFQRPRVITTGPGAQAATAAVERAAAEAPDRDNTLFILAGVAGGLAPVATVPSIRAVVNERGELFPLPFPHHPPDHAERVTLLGLDIPLCSPGVKQEWNELTGAALVDTESHAFAAACSRLHLTWTIVRGVSDTADESLPPRMLRWVTPSGRTRLWRAALDLARSPSLIPAVARVARRTGACLPLVADAVSDRVRAWHTLGLDRA